MYLKNDRGEPDLIATHLLVYRVQFQLLITAKYTSALIKLLCKSNVRLYCFKPCNLFQHFSATVPKGNRMIQVEGHDVTFGKPKDFPSYGWDNEYGEVSCL